MTAAAMVVTELRRRGADLVLEGEVLKLRAPRGSISQDLRDQIVETKPEILELLRAEAEFERRSWQIIRFHEVGDHESAQLDALVTGPYAEACERMYELMGEAWHQVWPRRTVQA